MWVGMQIGAATMEGSMEIPQKIKYGSPFDLKSHFWEYIPKGTQNTNSKEHKNTSVHCSVIYNCQDIEAAQVPISI